MADVKVAACETSVAKNVWTSSGFLREKEAFVSGGRSGSNFSFTRIPMPPQALHQMGGGGGGTAICRCDVNTRAMMMTPCAVCWDFT